jgi:hypothetical protein
MSKKQDNMEVEQVPEDIPIPETGEPEPLPPAPAIPDAQLVFDKTIAEKWLASSWLRLINVYLSVRFEPDGMAPRHVSFCLYLAARSLKTGGVIYVPKSLANNPHLADFTKGEAVGKYASFTRP